MQANMAKVIGPLMSTSASGQFAHAMTFDKRGFVREYVVPFNPKSTSQMTTRNALGDIQRELKTLGLKPRGELKAGLGYRWNSLVIAELMANDQAAFLAYIAEWDAFTTGKAAWTSADPATGLVNSNVGGVFYAVAKAAYDVAARLGATTSLVDPVEANSATVLSAWTADA
jgi:hypothetical protein